MSRSSTGSRVFVCLSHALKLNEISTMTHVINLMCFIFCYHITSVPMLLTQLVLPGMLQKKRGHIINIASLVARIPLPYSIAYATSKAGLAHFTASLRAEYRGTGVSASTIMAGQFTDTGLSAQGLKNTGVIKPNSVPTSPPEMAGQAVIRALKKDLSEIGIPAPALMFTRIPALGTLFLKGTGVIGMIKQIAEVRARMQE
ncbi:MAG TPA: SDR family NAD(P)-dependent oxidoreductase [Anaerolineales bacterium]|nr:SDR family NAD(P)-dependent oxidoreductase [Anaerolineales bacterium]